MTINQTIMLKYKRQSAACANDLKMKEFSTVSSQKLYNVVDVKSGRVVREGVPIEYAATYGRAAFAYSFVPA